jgi:putative transcriptional regulator
VERLWDDGRAVVELPMVEDQQAVVVELAAAGVSAQAVDNGLIDIRALRRRLGLTREQFACRYGLDLETLRNWEAGRREPDQAARSYLRAITNDPAGVEAAYAPAPI